MEREKKYHFLVLALVLCKAIKTFSCKQPWFLGCISPTVAQFLSLVRDCNAWLRCSVCVGAQVNDPC